MTDAYPIPVNYIKKLENRIKELEEENKRLKELKPYDGWRESSYRANMASKYGGEDW